MKILITEQQLRLLVEGNEETIYQRKDDPYEYKFNYGTWFARRKGKTKWIDITKYTSSIDILNSEFPQKEEDIKPRTETNLKYDKLKKDPNFISKAEEVSRYLGIRKEWLFKVIRKESKFNPQAENPIGCVGLIQFCPDRKGSPYKTIGNTKYSLNKIKYMSPYEQLDLIRDYYEPYKNRIRNYRDLYLFTFYPSAVGKPDDYVIGSESKNPDYQYKVSLQNPAIARAAGKTPGEPLTVSDFGDYVST